MKRSIFITIIVCLLTGICTLEQILVSVTLKELEIKSQELYEIVLDQENVNTNEVINLTKNLRDYWDQKENLLCFFINHKDMDEMGREITKMISYCKQNETAEFNTSLSLVIYYTKMFNHIMGISLQNFI